MKQLFYPYWLWEDFKAGLYSKKRLPEHKEMELAEIAKNILTNSIMFKHFALKVILEWKVSAEVNLTNMSRNRQAWIGQAACCIAYKIPEHITKFGWHMMTPEEQTEANRVADEVITVWENKHKCRNITSLKTFLTQAENE